MKTNKKSIVVIGAGIAGLTAAYRLKKLGHDVVVKEATDRPGGRMSTDRIEGQSIDRGAQFLSSAYSTVLDLIKEVGLENELIEVPPYSIIVRNGKLERLKFENISSRLSFTSKNLSLKNFGSLVSSGIALLKHRNQRKDDYSLWKEFDDQDGAQWAEHAFGKGTVDYLLEPMLEAFFFHPPEKNSKAVLFALMAFNLQKGKIMCLKNGLGSLTETLAKELEIEYGCRVTGLVRKENGVEVVTENGKLEAEFAVLATPAPLAKAILKKPTAIESQLLNTKYSSTYLLTFVTDGNWTKDNDLLKDVYGILIPRAERSLICAIGIENCKGNDKQTVGDTVNVMTEGIQTPALETKTDEEVYELVLKDLEHYFPSIGQHIKHKSLVRWKNAQTLSPIGRANAISEYRKQVGEVLPVILAGDYLGIGSTDSAAHTGTWAAQAICEFESKNR